MTVDWAHFTPISALFGGAMIGAAAGALMLGMGRIMGAAGILGRGLEFGAGDVAWRWWMIAGLALSPLVARPLWGAPAPVFSAGWATLAIGGLLVGVGSRLGSGCTSGHGVCGVARLSARSLAATAIFVAVGVATTFVARHGAG